MRLFLCLLMFGLPAMAQKAALRPAGRLEMPALADCNSPAHWREGRIHVLNSAGAPMISSGPSQFGLGSASPVKVESSAPISVWVESTWQDQDGTLYAWYHNEPGGLCANSILTVPRIGALVSKDNGRTFRDLGFVLQTGDPTNCGAQNGFFAAGHGDFSVLPDRDGKYFYFFFGNYGGDLAGQGVSVARMAFEDRDQPAGKVFKYFNGQWNEPGLGGTTTAVFPARVGWERSDTDSFWGPSIHWNTYLERYVILMNRSCCRSKWPQEGIYVTFNQDLADPAGWSPPERIMAKPPDYYPQVMGLEAEGTDKTAGQIARFYIHGRSQWEIVFFWPAPPQPEKAPPPAEPEAKPEPKREPTPALTIYAAGIPAAHLLSTAASPEGGGSIAASPSSPQGYYTPDAAVELTASPAPGFRFANWSGDLEGESNPATVTLADARSVTAKFVQAEAFLKVTLTRATAIARAWRNVSYEITVSNQGSSQPAAGAVTVKETPPAGLALVSMSGAGWACSADTCTRNDALTPGAAYPPITAVMELRPEATSPLLNRVAVSGGGSQPAEATDAGNIANPAVITSPVNGAALSGPAVVFRWSPGAEVTEYRIAIGREAYGDLYQGRVDGLSFTFAKMPADGGPVHVRLESRVAGGWLYSENAYTAAKPASPTR